ncbi:MAG TPA: class D sortase [Bryobacteraceae bacterium]|nr:class D sortase [Bryobacteraceae bacterium]
MATKTIPEILPLYTKPGLHTHNIRRKSTPPKPRRHRAVVWMRILFLVIAFIGFAYYGYTLGNRYLYQAYENWAFDQEIAGREATVKDWIMETTPLGNWLGYHIPAAKPLAQVSHPATSAGPAAPPALPEGALIGRVEIPRLHLSAIVRQGVDHRTLATAVGHVPSTQAPGDIGNFAIAAHRDTLFRALKDIKIGDTVKFQAPDRTYAYQVSSTQIVKPSDVSVLRPQGNQRLLTMITCYPFYYVGSAPKRFIVTAKLDDAVGKQ